MNLRTLNRPLLLLAVLALSSTAIAFQSQQAEQRSSGGLMVIIDSVTNDLYLAITSSPSRPAGDCSYINVIGTPAAYQFVCDRWWGSEVREIQWHWLSTNPPDDNTTEGIGSWTGISTPNDGYLYLRWTYDDKGQSTASGGLPD